MSSFYAIATPNPKDFFNIKHFIIFILYDVMNESEKKMVKQEILLNFGSIIMENHVALSSCNLRGVSVCVFYVFISFVFILMIFIQFLIHL